MRYDFSKIENDDPKSSSNIVDQEDPRTNFRIQNVCRNCTFFINGQSNLRLPGTAGLCKVKNPKGRVSSDTSRPDDERIKEANFLRVDATTTCDLFEVYGKHVIEKIERNTNKKFNFDGTPANPDVASY